MKPLSQHITESFVVNESINDFLKLLNDHISELSNNPCMIEEFAIEKDKESNTEFVNMTVLAGSKAAREMQKNFSTILNRKIYVYNHPLEEYSRRTMYHDYIVSDKPLDIKNIYKDQPYR